MPDRVEPGTNHQQERLDIRLDELCRVLPSEGATILPASRQGAANDDPIGLQLPDKHPALEKLGDTYPRAKTRGKLITRGDEIFFVKGVTYGTFKPLPTGELFPEPERVQQDFEAMKEAGINSVRVYTVPPRWLLDLAQENGLMLLVGIPWEQHLAFLDDNEVTKRIEKTCREAAQACAGHPALLAYSLGNEIKANIVRWHGAKRVEKFLKRLYHIVKKEDPEALVTYVNFPTTEYLDLDFLDLISFNVYLESPEKLQHYLARLQTLAKGKPLLLAEVGLDSLRNGDEEQARTLTWQLDQVFQSGCAGTFVYAWTDEWFTEGHAIEDWDFGLTTRERVPKPALASVVKSFDRLPFDPEADWPRMSIVICSYNGSATIAESIHAVLALDYPDYELIVIDDGSTDGTAQIADSLGAHVIRTENRGLSNARNTGYQAASGEIVVYLDDDAYPDIYWLRYLAIAFRDPNVGAAGGPNLPPPQDSLIADCVAHSPGSPMEVLLSDTRAEHIPGCNMAIRRELLETLGGFDARFRAAGDDVDMCWRILESGAQIAFHPAACNWHHRRDSLAAYFSQQQGYGKAEALLAQKWPEKYNQLGHINWQGVVYGHGVTKPLSLIRNRIYSGVWGSAAFQRLYTTPSSKLTSWLLIPEFNLLLIILLPMALAGVLFSKLIFFTLLFCSLLGLLLGQSIKQGLLYKSSNTLLSASTRIKRCCIISYLHLLQPFYRLKGRLMHGLYPKPEHSLRALTRASRWHFLRPVYKGEIWEGQNKCPLQRLSHMQHRLHAQGVNAENGSNFSPWDMQLKKSPFAITQLRLMVEEHGEQIERVRYRLSNKLTLTGKTIAIALLFSAVFLWSGILPASMPLMNSLWWACATFFGLTTIWTTNSAMSIFDQALRAEYTDNPGASG